MRKLLPAHFFALAGLSVASVVRTLAAGAESAGNLAGAENAFQRDVIPFVSKNCFSCHGSGKSKGDVVLEKFKDAQSMQKDPDVWDMVVEKLAHREMPPEDEPQPSQVEVDNVIAAIHGVRTTLAANTPPNAGRVTLRRLNKTEFNNTVRDLIGVDFKPAEDFPADDVGYGFDNIGDVLSVSPLLLEKYLAATESILEQAIIVAQPPKPTRATVAAERLPAALTEGEIGGLASFEEGDYLVRLSLGSNQSARGSLRAMLRVDGKDVKEFTVKPSAQPTKFEVKMAMKPKTQRLTVAFFNPMRPAAGAKEQAPALQVQSLEVEGPFNVPPLKYPEVHTRLMAHKAGLAPREAAREIVARFAAKAYRRPLRAGEVEKCLAFYDAAEKRGEQFEQGVRAALYRVLMSPDFLFRVERDPTGVKAGESYTINEYELASRLSYFLWNSMPDDALLALAAKGQLRGNLAGQVRRMIKDPKSSSFLQNFCEQWLTLRKLDLISPDPGMFPAFDRRLQQAMLQESDLFFEAVAREDRSVLELLNANFTFVNEPLAKLYGIEGVTGDKFIRVKAPPHRGGVLTMASVLALNSNATRTSPVKRGKFIMEEILNTPPPPPPANVPPLEEGKQLKGTMRQVLEQHRANPVCASCHSKMDPLGFAFENFDPIGAWREKDGASPIDASGVLPDGKKFEGADGLKAVLDTKRDLFVRNVVNKMLTYSIGRGLEFYDRPTVEQIVTALSKNDYRFSSLVAEIVNSDPFQKRTATGENL